MIRLDCPDAEERMKQDEWLFIQKKWPTVAFNSKLNRPEVNRHRHLVVCEPATNFRQQWVKDFARQFQTYITFNTTIYNAWRIDINCRLIYGVPQFNRYYWLDSFIPIESKYDSVCCMNNWYYLGTEGDILFLRPLTVRELFIRGVNVDVYAPKDRAWGGPCYKGQVTSPLHHSHINQLNVMNKYRFCLCFESTYHSLWSRDFITERMFNCFKAKVIPIYIGCYNIEEYVPREFFIDFRDYFNKQDGYDKLVQDLKDFPMNKYAEQVDAAYEWQQSNEIGSIQVLEANLETL